MNEIKRNNMIYEKSNEIKECQQLLVEEDILGSRYNEIFNKLTILKKELDILLKINSSNFNIIMKNLSNVDEKYGYLVTLPKEKLDVILAVVEEFNSFTKGYKVDFQITDDLNDLKEKALLSEIKVTGIDNSLDCEKLLELVLDMKGKFLENSQNLKDQLSLVDFNYYNTLFLNVKNKTFSNVELLKHFYKLNQGTLIDMILNDKKELHKLKRSYFKSKKTEENIEKLKNRILQREESLLKNVGYYVLNVIYDIKRKLYININETKYANYTSLYFEILDKIDNKNEKYDKIIKSLRFALETLTRIEKSLKSKLSLIDLNINNEIESKDIDITSLDMDKMNSIIASVNVYKGFGEPEFNLEEVNMLKF